MTNKSQDPLIKKDYFRVSHRVWRLYKDVSFSLCAIMLQIIYCLTGAQLLVYTTGANGFLPVARLKSKRITYKIHEKSAIEDNFSKFKFLFT